MDDVLHMPFGWRVRAGGREMVARIAERMGVNPAARFAWVPAAMLVVTLVTSLASIVYAYSTRQAQTEAKVQAVSAESRQLISAAADLRQATAAMEVRLGARLEGIQATVNASASDVATLKVRVDEREKRYEELRQLVQLQALQMQTLREKLAAAGFKP